jgi:hypothetical protein
VRPDTAGQGGAPTDSVAPRPSPAAAPAAAPVDSALAEACQISAGAPPDLVAVQFRATTTAAEREAVAKQVGGTVVGPGGYQAPGAWYLHVPNSGIDPSVADRLIRLPPVLQVGATRCPR